MKELIQCCGEFKTKLKNLEDTMLFEKKKQIIDCTQFSQDFGNKRKFKYSEFGFFSSLFLYVAPPLTFNRNKIFFLN